MTKYEQAILAAWRLQQIQQGDVVDVIASRWLAEAIELLKELAKDKT
jgi:DNA-directed RNA polymerase subunit K/omega